MADTADGQNANGKTTIQSVARAARLLLAVAASPDGISAKTAADEFGLSLPTTYHLLTTLTAEGLLAKDSRRFYVLGPRAAALAAAVQRDTRTPEYYLGPLRELATATGETAYLAAWRNGAITVLQTIEGARAVRVAGLATGYADNIHARASGKLLMAFAPSADRQRLLASTPLRALTNNTITDRDQLDAELQKIRAEGLAYDLCEFNESVYCVSAPIIEASVVVGCYTVSMPSERWPTQREHIVRAVQRAAQSASNLRMA